MKYGLFTREPIQGKVVYHRRGVWDKQETYSEEKQPSQLALYPNHHQSNG